MKKITYFLFIMFNTFAVLGQTPTSINESFTGLSGQIPSGWEYKGSGNLDFSVNDHKGKDPNKLGYLYVDTGFKGSTTDNTKAEWVITSKMYVEKDKEYECVYYYSLPPGASARYQLAYGDSQDVVAMSNVIIDHSATPVPPTTTGGIDVWKEKKGYFTAKKTGYVYFGFKVFQAVEGLTKGLLGIDELSIHKKSMCIKPTDVKVSAIGETTVTIEWKDTATNSNGYKIRLMRKGDDVMTGKPLFEETSTTKNINLTNITSGSYYDAYVRSDCGSSDGLSFWTNVVSFRTKCASSGGVDTFYEDFSESMMPPAVMDMNLMLLPFCWSRLISGNVLMNPYDTTNAYVSGSGASGTMMLGGDSYDNGKYTMLISPELNSLKPNAKYVLKFKARRLSCSGTCTGTKIEIGTMSDKTNKTTYTKFKTIDLTETYQDFSIPFDTYTKSGDSYIVFNRIDDGGSYAVELDDVLWESTATASVDKINTQVVETLTVYPNPTNGILNIGTKEGIVKEVRVFNILGKEIMSAKKQSTIDLSAYTKGFYILNVMTDKGTKSVKIIKK